MRMLASRSAYVHLTALGLIVVASCSTAPERVSARALPLDAPCQTTSDGTTVTVSLTSKAGSGVFTLVQAQALDGSSTRITETITISGLPYLTSQVTSTPDGASTADTTYGSAYFTGIGKDHYASDGKTLTGEVDGRAIVPVPVSPPPSSATFQDGKPPPSVTVDPGAQKAAAAVLTQGRADLGQCDAGGGTQSMRLLDQPGHLTDAPGSADCIGATAACLGVEAGCAAAAAIGCIASGPFYGLCLTAAAAGCLAGYLVCLVGIDLIGGGVGAACCPVACGQRCCAGSETCLNTATGVCCSAGTTTCGGLRCCNVPDPGNGVVGETCIASTGTCCPNTQEVCGTQCCAPGSHCATQGNECCAPGAAVCNGACCGRGEVCANGACRCATPCGDTCCAGSDTCIDGACCPSGMECGGTCCSSGQTCVNGACACQPTEANCGSYCCPGALGCGNPNGPNVCGP
jgi:hypothetical protein